MERKKIEIQKRKIKNIKTKNRKTKNKQIKMEFNLGLLTTKEHIQNGIMDSRASQELPGPPKLQ